MSTTWTPSQKSWTERINRAAELAERNAWASGILPFYLRVLKLQCEIYKGSQVKNVQSSIRDMGLRNALNVGEAAAKIPELVAVVRESGPAKLAETAKLLQESPHEVISELLTRWAESSAALRDDGRAFFARVVLEPQAERLAQAAGFTQPTIAGNKCPICGSNPQLAVIRPEGDGGKRMLLCSLCHLEWEFRRILCPACGEENHEQLPRYSAEGIAAIRVEACDTCRCYLKSVDLTIDGLAVPEVDEVATVPLDLWAAEHEYNKIELNLMGF